MSVQTTLISSNANTKNIKSDNLFRSPKSQSVLVMKSLPTKSSCTHLFEYILPTYNCSCRKIPIHTNTIVLLMEFVTFCFNQPPLAHDLVMFHEFS